MRLTQAFDILNAPPPSGEPFRIFLACGFQPLHLKTFLEAHARQAFPDRPIELTTGLFGDLAGNLERAAAENYDLVAVALEWPDLDPRLSLRNSGAWSLEAVAGLPSEVSQALSRLTAALEQAAQKSAIVGSLPTVAPPPLSYFPTSEADPTTAQLEAALATSLADWTTRHLGRWIAPSRLETASPAANRFDPKGELRNGFPYTKDHASALAAELLRLAQPHFPKKGLITDLDNTMWSGIVGEDGPSGVHWDLDHKAQIHAIYQKLLASFAETGVLLAIASKNSPEPVADALARPDILAPAKKLFPQEIHWGQKSESVSRILEAWNIGAGDVVFVDDSPVELEEVQNAHPAITCLRFPEGKPANFVALLSQLRQLFGKHKLQAEDALRVDSLRAASEIKSGAANGQSREEFLAGLQGRIVLTSAKAEDDSRAFELINKTNQFNLNGERYTDADWAAYRARDDSFLTVAYYEDRLGALGKIGVVLGRVNDGVVDVDSWVMSCRAFSRRIEHTCLAWICDRFAPETVRFAFKKTERNGPLQDFLGEIGEPTPDGIDSAGISKRVTPAIHKVEDRTDG